MADDVELNKARMIPIDPASNQPDTGAAIEVQFNPVTLKVTFANTLKADAGASGTSEKAAQYVDKSSSKLSLELVFDTTMDISDVRKKTREIAETFMAPIEQAGEEKPLPPKRCLFQWGAFAFEGMVESYDETLDFFSSEGIPLRATVALRLAEDKFQFRSEDVQAAAREQPSFAPTTPETPVDRAAEAAGKAPTDWRESALFNGIENPRLPGVGGIVVPGAGVGGVAGAGFRFGASASLGSAVPGAFSATGGAGVGGTVRLGLGRRSE